MNTVAIVGKPNTGKSTFFNRICNKPISIVENIPGVTRDRIYGEAEWAGQVFSVIDTGGIDFNEKTQMQKHITTQAEIAIDLADVVLFMVDGKTGLTKADYDASKVLRKCKKPIFVVVNKLDNDKMEAQGYDFYSLGFSNVEFISATAGRGIGDLLDKIVACFKKPTTEKSNNEDALKIAVVGKPNAGKSSLINKLLNEERLVVSDVAGTTRDSVDSVLKFKGKKYLLIDTAGMRRKSKIEKESLELYSVLRTLESVKRCDVALIVFDCAEGISSQDLQIASYVARQGKPNIIVMNKWDLVEKDSFAINEYNAMLKRELAFMSYFKPIFVSALTGQRVTNLLSEAQNVFEKSKKRIKTGALNELLQEAFRLSPPANVKGVQLKLFYATQAGVTPPTFVLFVNNASAVQGSYLRYIENFIRKSIDFEGVPIKIVLRNRGEE